MKEGAERITRRVLDDAHARAESIKADAAKKAEAVESEARQKAARKKEQIIEQARKEADEQKRRIIGIAQLEARKELLAAKQELIGEVFNKALDQILELDDGSYFDIIRRMLLAYVETGRETVYCSARDLSRFTDKFWQDVNTSLREQGKKGELKVSEEPRDIRGGFILEAEGIEINCSFESLLEMGRDELEPEVAAVLFQ